MAEHEVSSSTSLHLVCEVETLVRSRQSYPEQILFLSVILQALLDATKPEQDNESEDAILSRSRAKAWFSASIGVTAEDFQSVCDLADVDAGYTKSFAYKVLQSKEINYIRRRINTVLS